MDLITYGYSVRDIGIATSLLLSSNPTHYRAMKITCEILHSKVFFGSAGRIFSALWYDVPIIKLHDSNFPKNFKTITKNA